MWKASGPGWNTRCWAWGLVVGVTSSGGEGRDKDGNGDGGGDGDASRRVGTSAAGVDTGQAGGGDQGLDGDSISKLESLLRSEGTSDVLSSSPSLPAPRPVPAANRPVLRWLRGERYKDTPRTSLRATPVLASSMESRNGFPYRRGWVSVRVRGGVGGNKFCR